MLPIVDAVTEPGDRLIVGPGDLRKTPYSEAFLYYLLPELVPGTRYIEMDPGVANAADSGLADEVARRRRRDPLDHLGRLERAERLAAVRARRARTRCSPATSAWSGASGSTRSTRIAASYELLHRAC